MKLVYVAGPFRSGSAWGVHQNVQAALAVGFQVASLGAVPVIPHSMFQAFDRTLTDEFWLEGTLALMRPCDAVIVVSGWEKSKGTCGEIEEARAAGIPVFFTVADFWVWLSNGGGK